MTLIIAPYKNTLTYLLTLTDRFLVDNYLSK